MIRILKNNKIRFTFDHYSRKPVFLAGDFNHWDETSHPMLNINGRWVLDMELKPGEYEFKYFCDGIYYNDYCAHKYVDNAWGSDNSVVIVEQQQTEKHAPVILLKKQAVPKNRKKYINQSDYLRNRIPASRDKKHQYN